MRYKTGESTVIAGSFASGENVTVRIVNAKIDEIVELNSTACNESDHISGMYLYDTKEVIDAGHYLYEMSDGTNRFYGKFTVGGSADETFGTTDRDKLMATATSVEVNSGNEDIRGIIESVQLGSWEMVNKQMVMYDTSGSELARFDLFDPNGNKSITNVTKRVRV